jgi:hypothetical protein
MGNVRDAGYDFRKVWFSRQANEVRRAVKSRGCYCPVANISYTNMMADPISVFKVGINVLRGGPSGGKRA